VSYFTKLEKGIITKIKGENMKYLLFMVLLVAVIITAGCANYIPKQPFSVATTEADFGSAYSNSEQEVIVYSAQKNETFTSVFYNVSSTKEAASGNTFVIIDARIKNIGADKITVFPHDFSMVDAEGKRFDKEPFHGDGGLMAGELEKNQYKKGKVLFEVPQNSKDLVVYYDLNGKLLSWKIN
jgi:uncharacterized protein (UPF0333 family)